MNEIKTQTEIRKQLIDAQDNFIVCLHEAENELKLLYTEGSQYINKGISSDNDMKDCSIIVAKINKKEKEIDEQRKSVTRILDYVKQDWINRQNNVLENIIKLKKELIIINNKYLSDKEEKALIEKEKIEREKKQKIERELLPIRIKNCVERALNEEISDISQKMALSWARLTLDTFHEKIEILKKFKPKVTYDKLLSYIDIQALHIKKEEVEQAIRDNVDYDYFCSEYEKSFLEIKKTYLENIDKKLADLNSQSESERFIEEQRIQQDLINKKAQDIAIQKEKEEKLKIEEQNKIIQAELESQIKLSYIANAKGRTQWVAHIVGDVDWNKIITLYSKDNGIKGLEFLLTWLCRHGGRPEIKGIKYESSKKVINRIY